MKKILVIEDNLDVSDNLCEILELSGYEVLSAMDGAEGLQICMKERPDLVLCDVMMPRLDGYGVLKIIRANPMTSHIPLIFLTAKINREDFRRGMGLGADDYITKPFDDTELLAAIEMRIKMHKVQEENWSSKDQSNRGEDPIKVWMDTTLKKQELRKVGVKSFLYREEEKPFFLYYIKSGLAKETMTAEDGKILTTRLAMAGNLLGINASISQERYTTSAMALTECEVYQLSIDDFKNTISSNRLFANQIMIELSKATQKYERLLLNHAYFSVRKKVANALLAYQKVLQKNPDLKFQPSREDLSFMAGVAKETLIRTLSTFKSEGLIQIENREIIIPDTDLLRDIQQ